MPCPWRYCINSYNSKFVTLCCFNATEIFLLEKGEWEDRSLDLFYCLIFSAVPSPFYPNLKPPTVASHLYQLSRSPSSNNLFLISNYSRWESVDRRGEKKRSSLLYSWTAVSTKETSSLSHIHSKYSTLTSPPPQRSYHQLMQTECQTMIIWISISCKRVWSLWRIQTQVCRPRARERTNHQP